MVMEFRELFFPLIADSNSKTSEFAKFVSGKLMQMQLPNRPDLWEKLTPRYAPGCKRIIISDDYFPALNRNNVTLETRGISRISEEGIVVDGQEQELDLIIFATGFRSVNFMHPIKVHGHRGRLLSEIWSKGAHALYGVAVESLPNFAMLYGPNTNLGHNSVILMIESQARYVLHLITAVLNARQREGQALTIMPKPERVDDFNQDLQRSLSGTSFADSNCASWYKTMEGLITNNWSGSAIDYQKLLSKLDWSDFELEGYGADSIASKRLNIGRVREETLFGLRSLAVSTIGTLALVAVLKKLKAQRKINVPAFLSRLI